MVRITGDENLSDAERIAAIQEATGTTAGQAETLLAQARTGGAPFRDIVVVGTSAVLMFSFPGIADVVLSGPSGVEVRSFTFGDPAARLPERETEGVLVRG